MGYDWHRGTWSTDNWCCCACVWCTEQGSSLVVYCRFRIPRYMYCYFLDAVVLWCCGARSFALDLFHSYLFGLSVVHFKTDQSTSQLKFLNGLRSTHTQTALEHSVARIRLTHRRFFLPSLRNKLFRLLFFQRIITVDLHCVFHLPLSVQSKAISRLISNPK